MVSPGEDTQSGVKGRVVLVMVISNENNTNSSNFWPINTSILSQGDGVVIRLKYKSFTTFRGDRSFREIHKKDDPSAYALTKFSKYVM